MKVVKLFQHSPIRWGVAILFFAYCLLTWREFIVTVGFCPRLFCDFIDYYYPMGEAILRTGYPVTGFLYSPFNALLLAAFRPIGLDLSLFLWGFLQVTAIVLYLFRTHRFFRAGPPRQLLFAALILLSYPLWLNFLAGNTSVFIMAALLGMFLMSERGNYAIAAILLAFAVSFKFYPIIFIIPVIAGRNTRLTFLAIAACVVLLIAIPAIFLWGSGMFHFYETLLNSFRESAWVVANPHSQFFPHFILRLAGATGAEAPILTPILYIFSFCVATLNLLFVFLIQRARMNQANLWSFQIVFLTIPFVLKTSWPIDFAYLPFVQAFLIWHIVEQSARSDFGGTRVLGGRAKAMLILISVSIIFSSVVFFNLLKNSFIYGFCGFALLANILLLAVVYTELLPAIWRSLSRRQ